MSIVSYTTSSIHRSTIRTIKTMHWDTGVVSALYHPWLPKPFSFKPKILAVQLGAAGLARAETWIGRGDQFFLAARRGSMA